MTHNGLEVIESNYLANTCWTSELRRHSSLCWEFGMEHLCCIFAPAASMLLKKPQWHHSPLGITTKRNSNHMLSLKLFYIDWSSVIQCWFKCTLKFAQFLGCHPETRVEITKNSCSDCDIIWASWLFSASYILLFWWLFAVIESMFFK